MDALTGGARTQWDTFYRLQNRRLARSLARMQLPPERVEDVLQEVWRATITRWDSFREPNGAQRLLAWSYRVAHNKAVDLIRRLNRRPAKSLAALPVEPVDTKAVRPSKTAESEERLDALLEVLRREQPMNYWLICEHYLMDRPITELAEESSLTEHAIHNRLPRALKRLRSLAEKFDFDGESAT
jgi:RNA polymerase sigma-70 factor (ECF subfamily)